MPFQNPKTLSNGVTGNYWAVSSMTFTRATMTVNLTVSLYLDSTPGRPPLMASHQFSFVITPAEISGNLIAWAHNKILAYANSDVANMNGIGTRKGCPDLVGATVVA